MELLTPWHLALILLGFVLLFGYKKLPDASRSLGRSLRIFKAEMRDLSTGPGTGSEPSPPAEPPAIAGAASVEELERQAQEAEAEAEALRARARGHIAGS